MVIIHESVQYATYSYMPQTIPQTGQEGETKRQPIVARVNQQMLSILHLETLGSLTTPYEEKNKVIFSSCAFHAALLCAVMHMLDF